jgi:small subunit ribosomal protein S5
VARKKKLKHEETGEEMEKEEEMKEETKEEAKEELAAAEEKAKKEAGGEETAEDVEKEIEEIVKAKDIEEVVIKKTEQRAPASSWIPKTELGREVVQGRYKDIREVLAKGKIIMEPQIVDYLVPDLAEELILIGGTPGKGGGIRRTPTRMTARMHKSGRRFKLTAVVVVGNGDGVVGIGKATSNEHRTAIEKALQHAKLNVISVRRGCGSWECNCGGTHSIPFKTTGKTGSVEIELNPTPMGVGVVADKESKKILKLAGIKDVRASMSGQSSTRINLALAMFEALKNLSKTKGDI